MQFAELDIYINSHKNTIKCQNPVRLKAFSYICLFIYSHIGLVSLIVIENL